MKFSPLSLIKICNFGLQFFKMKTTLNILIFILLIGMNLQAQDYQTGTLMTYNLTFYRETSNFCNGSNNDANVKDAALKKIIQYAQPNLLVCNEIGSNFANPNKIIENALNVDGETSWKQCGYSNNSSNLVNMLFYDSDVFELKKQDYLTQSSNGTYLVRVIDFYTLYYKDPKLSPGSDTTFITVVSAHLKAGSTTADETQRDLATKAVMEYIENNDIKGNLYMCGDFNVYDAAEQGFQNLINWTSSDYNFEDPIDEIGSWHNNASYKYYHTQSTRVTSNGCLSGGGMDDRFDFILGSGATMNGAKNIEYINNSYKAIGQDGNRFNESIISPKNYSVPAGIDTALYNLSDHLPVKLDFLIKKIEVGIDEASASAPDLIVQSVVQETLSIRSTVSIGKTELTVTDVNGKMVAKHLFTFNVNSEFIVDVQTLNSGMYFLNSLSANGEIFSAKFIKK